MMPDPGPTGNALQVVWFKRDLRLADHAPLAAACATGLPTLLLFVVEPHLMALPDYDHRHYRFALEAVADLQDQLAPLGHSLLVCHAEVPHVLDQLRQHHPIRLMFSHQETGTLATYARDLALAAYCRQWGISWTEMPSNAVRRGLPHRRDWQAHWRAVMQAPQHRPDLRALVAATLAPDLRRQLEGPPLPLPLAQALNQPPVTNPVHGFQPGGERFAHRYLSSFLTDRAQAYGAAISKPAESRRHCSRLSPYLTWGCVSVRQVVQATSAARKTVSHKRHLDFFMSRMAWHCHFVQKLEADVRYQTQNLNPAYDTIRREPDPRLIDAWQQGQTGFPLVDACMRCVVQTGYLNFRMRALLVSFLTHHLWQPWQPGALHLARAFLDYDPGIHYPQFQMQAGTVGVHTLRTYNPYKQAQEHDPTGEFVRRWVPELAALPAPYLHNPQLLSPLEQQFYNIRLGHHYPLPVVDYAAATDRVRRELWAVRHSADTQRHATAILRRHSMPRRHPQHGSLFDTAID